MNLPNFLVLGAEKSGTTYLKHNLNAHADVFVPSQKELHFFDKDENYNKGLEWYASFFAGTSGEKAIGEITPGYLVSKVVPSRIKETLPRAKLIAILRNPIDRAYSAYWMNVSKSLISGSFKNALQLYPHLLDGGKYGTQLLNYLEYFPKESILLLNFDEIQNPKLLFSKIFSFLDVDDYFPSRSNEIIFSSSIPRSITLGKLLFYVQRIVRKMGSQQSTRKLQLFIEKINTTKSSYPPMAPDIKRLLSEYYSKEFDILEAQFGFSLEQWKI